MQTTTPMIYSKCHSGLTYASEPALRDNIETASANAVNEVKTVFFTPEGIYRQMTISEFIRSNRIPLNQTVCPISNTLVRVSFLKVSSNRDGENHALNPEYIERICFNVGREVYVYDYGGINGDAEFSKPIDKRVYKGTFPTCHDYNQETATLDSSVLIVGFTAGQIQLFDPYKKDSQSKLYNEDRSIDKSPVTHLRWIPGQSSLFMVAYASGNLYVYNEEHAWVPNAPVYQLVKQGEGFSVHACKSKTPRNPVARWTIGPTNDGAATAINQFEFSPAMITADQRAMKRAQYLAIVGQDGYLRVFDYVAMESVGFMRSYFGGLLCLAWSPDGRLIATGGEDDMLTIYAVTERRVCCRGQGHKSWVSQVAFDPVASICNSTVPPTLSNSASSTAFAAKVSEENDSNRSQDFNAKCTVSLKKNAKISPKPTTESMYTNGFNSLARSSDPSTQSTSAESRTGLVNMSVRSPKDSFNQSILETDVPRTPVSYLNGDACRANNCCQKPKTMTSCASCSMSPTHGQVSTSLTTTPPTTTRNCYRVGSVGYDTQLCLWDVSEDLLNSCDTVNGYDDAQYASTSTGTSVNSQNRTVISIGMPKTFDKFPPAFQSKAQSPADSTDTNSVISQSTCRSDSTKSKFRKLHRRGLSFGLRLNDRLLRSNGTTSTANSLPPAAATLRRNNNATISAASSATGDETSTTGGASSLPSIFGSAQCPRMDDVPVVEPLVCKKIAHERLTVLQFREDCLVTACQEGIVLTWARPDKSFSALHNNIYSKTRYYSTSSANAAADYECT